MKTVEGKVVFDAFEVAPEVVSATPYYPTFTQHRVSLNDQNLDSWTIPYDSNKTYMECIHYFPHGHL
jgi:hypothetical protein